MRRKKRIGLIMLVVGVLVGAGSDLCYAATRMGR